MPWKDHPKVLALLLYKNCHKGVGVHRLPDNLLHGRKMAALQALPLLIRLLGGQGFVRKGIHSPILQKVGPPSSASTSELLLSLLRCSAYITSCDAT